jgi:hypothetical protein
MDRVLVLEKHTAVTPVREPQNVFVIQVTSLFDIHGSVHRSMTQ